MNEKNENKSTGKKKVIFNIAFSAIFLSLSVVLDYVFKLIPFLQMPNGGGITIGMLPLVLISIICGGYYGLLSGIAYGVINCFVIDAYGFNVYSFFLDYIIAFAGFSIIAIFRKKILDGSKFYFVLGFVLGGIIRWISSGFSGVINAGLWGYDKEFLENIFGAGHGSKIWLYLYSFVYYNLPYIGVSVILCIVIGLILLKRINKINIEK